MGIQFDFCGFGVCFEETLYMLVYEETEVLFLGHLTSVKFSLPITNRRSGYDHCDKCHILRRTFVRMFCKCDQESLCLQKKAEPHVSA